MNAFSDQELIDKMLSGEEAHYSQLVRKYQRAVYAIAFRYLRSHDEADEVAQEAFIRAYFSLRTYNRQYKFYTWLLRITVNLCHDALRKRQRYVPLEENTRSGTLADPLETAIQSDSCERIRDEIDALPGDQREVILLRADRELSYDEIGKILDIPVGTVMSRLFRARKTLLERLKEVL